VLLISKLLKEPRTKGFWQNQRTAQQTPAVIRAVLRCQNHGSQKSKNQSWYITTVLLKFGKFNQMTAYTTTGSPLVLSGKPPLVLWGFSNNWNRWFFGSDSFPPQNQELTVLCKNYTTLFWTSCHRYIYHCTQNCAQPLRPPSYTRMFNSATFCIRTYFQLKAYGQYGLHGSVINIPTNLNVVQLVSSWMSSADYIIAFFNFKAKYKSTCMSSYVPPNIMIKMLEEVCKTPSLYINANVSIQLNWQRGPNEI